jgi:hypothetical protein
MKKSMILIAMLALTLACNKQNGTASTDNSGNPAGSSVASTAPSLTPEQLGELGAKIKAHPKDAQKILADAGLTESAFETQIRKISSDPAASKRYAAAYKKAAA